MTRRSTSLCPVAVPAATEPNRLFARTSDFACGVKLAKTPSVTNLATYASAVRLTLCHAATNVPADAGATWVVSDKPDPHSDGGFIYKPDESKATTKLAGQGESDKETLRSYGSMTYAGLKSMIYARLDKNDVRVKAAAEWARRNYRLDENPGMGPEGHFYYLLTFAKAHAALGTETVKTPDGKEHAWRQDLIDTLAALQKPEGAWVNDKQGRWMESLPELVTSYAVLTLEVARGNGE